ncbi:MAG TPA: DUF2384 domain-containing protein [Candidatus Agrococcus pullicola]|uniref:DUF2384 domain-containing protein n=1 Tax=Candidatus Agrococcus pullicola TaxID=2838429 RepID=A0A9D1YXB3_9MICO|nr:DUF2384 domain-containing protein [Candidatus Agrococcus pullicola]
MPQETAGSSQHVDPAPLSSAIGEFWPLAQTAVRLESSETELLKLVASGSVLSVVTADEQLLFPAFQFDERRVLPDLVPVLETLMPASDGWQVTQWLMTPSRQLGGRTPLETSRKGDAKFLRRLSSLAKDQAKTWARTTESR